MRDQTIPSNVLSASDIRAESEAIIVGDLPGPAGATATNSSSLREVWQGGRSVDGGRGLF